MLELSAENRGYLCGCFSNSAENALFSRICLSNKHASPEKQHH
jgi:hypothetical protein